MDEFSHWISHPAHLHNPDMTDHKQIWQPLGQYQKAIKTLDNFGRPQIWKDMLLFWSKEHCWGPYMSQAGMIYHTVTRWRASVFSSQDVQNCSLKCLKGAAFRVAKFHPAFQRISLCRETFGSFDFKGQVQADLMINATFGRCGHFSCIPRGQVSRVKGQCSEYGNWMLIKWRTWPANLTAPLNSDNLSSGNCSVAVQLSSNRCKIKNHFSPINTCQSRVDCGRNGHGQWIEIGYLPASVLFVKFRTCFYTADKLVNKNAISKKLWGKHSQIYIFTCIFVLA